MLQRSGEADHGFCQALPQGQHRALLPWLGGETGAGDGHRKVSAGPANPVGRPQDRPVQRSLERRLGLVCPDRRRDPRRPPKNHAQRPEVVEIFRGMAAGLKRTQDPISGRWFQVVDKGSEPGNWTDNSGSAMFIYAIQRGIELGLLNAREYAPVVAKGYKGIVANAKINDQGLVDIYSACAGLCVQANYAAYINYPRSVNGGEAVAGFLWATTIVEKPGLQRGKKR
ncbi:MAG: hypothetical protein EHM65_11215 [Acidobacteriales bacterium]|nr:MAG: hypothetical protein EHM65_11215 [Terriglobales bacterium]